MLMVSSPFLEIEAIRRALLTIEPVPSGRNRR